MGIKITDGSMSSDVSPHSAGLWPMPEAGGIANHVACLVAA